MPRIEVKETNDEHNYTPTGGVFLILKGDEFLLDTTELERITREEWETFLAKAQGHARVGHPVRQHHHRLGV